MLAFGKTGWREVPISEETRRLLVRVAAESPDEMVFHGDKGSPLSRFGVYRIVRESMEKAGIKGPNLVRIVSAMLLGKTSLFKEETYAH